MIPEDQKKYDYTMMKYGASARLLRVMFPESNIRYFFQAPLLRPTPVPRPEGADICGNISFPKPILVLNYKTVPEDQIHNIS